MEARLPRHIFISYAREDEAFVERLRNDLEAAGVPIWIDTEDLIPGTPDWEKTIREATEASFAVILVGSPAARDSRFVYAEFSLAQGKHVPVIPVWYSGTLWVDSAPLEAIRIQYVDLRGSSYQTNGASVFSSLKATIEKRRPRHCLIEDPFAGWYDHSKASPGFDGVASYVSVFLDRPPFDRPREQRTRQEKMVVFNPEAYDLLQSLLDGLYLHYLAQRYAPISYGHEWVLLEKHVRTARFRPEHPFSPGKQPHPLHRAGFVEVVPFEQIDASQ